MLEDELVDLRADAPDDLAVALRQPEFRLRMLEPRVLARRDQAVDFVLERRNPMGVVLVDLPCEVDEGLLVLLALDGADGEGRAAHGEALAAERAKRQLRLRRLSP